MNKLLEYIDDITLYETGQDGYGDHSIKNEIPVKALFLQGTSQNGLKVEAISSDAHVYLDIDNPFIVENAYRLEGMYILANTLNGNPAESWYRISSVKVGQRKLLDNALNNVHCRLTKCEALK